MGNEATFNANQYANRYKVTVRDMKAEAFLQPFFSPNQGTALRAFDDACQKSDSPFYVHPNDFVLYEIGEYTDETGLLKALNPVKMFACAADFVKPDMSKVLSPKAKVSLGEILS